MARIINQVIVLVLVAIVFNMYSYEVNGEQAEDLAKKCN